MVFFNEALWYYFGIRSTVLRQSTNACIIWLRCINLRSISSFVSFFLLVVSYKWFLRGSLIFSQVFVFKSPDQGLLFTLLGIWSCCSNLIWRFHWNMIMIIACIIYMSVIFILYISYYSALAENCILFWMINLSFL